MRIFITFLIGCWIVGSNLTIAQESTTSDPLTPGIRLKPNRLGIVVGPSFHMQDGSFTTQCGDRFEKGAQTGYLIGVVYKRFLTASPFAYGVRLSYQTRNISAIYNEYELIDNIPSSTPGQTLEESILFRNEAQIDFSLLTLTPYVEWSPFWNAFAHVGIMPGIVLSSHVTHTKNPAQEYITLDDGQVVRVSFGENETGEPQDVIEDGAVPQLQQFQVAIVGGVGIDIPVSEKMVITPLYQYAVPLTVLSERGASFKIRASQILISATINL